MILVIHCSLFLWEVAAVIHCSFLIFVVLGVAALVIHPKFVYPKLGTITGGWGFRQLLEFVSLMAT